MRFQARASYIQTDPPLTTVCGQALPLAGSRAKRGDPEYVESVFEALRAIRAAGDTWGASAWVRMHCFHRWACHGRHDDGHMVGTCRYVDRGGWVLRIQRTVLGDAADVSHWHGCCCRHRMDQFDWQSRRLLRTLVCWCDEGYDGGLLWWSLRVGAARANRRLRLCLLPAHPNCKSIACCARTRRTLAGGLMRPTCRCRISERVAGIANVLSSELVKGCGANHAPPQPSGIEWVRSACQVASNGHVLRSTAACSGPIPIPMCVGPVVAVRGAYAGDAPVVAVITPPAGWPARVLRLCQGSGQSYARLCSGMPEVSV